MFRIFVRSVSRVVDSVERGEESKEGSQTNGRCRGSEAFGDLYLPTLGGNRVRECDMGKSIVVTIVQKPLLTDSLESRSGLSSTNQT